MGSIEDNQWVDMLIDKIGFALTKVDESIQKSIELWKELTKDIDEDQPTHITTGQPDNGKSGEEDSSQDKSVAEVKERPIQHWAMRLDEVKESPSQHWAMCASKTPESLIQEQGNDQFYCNEEKEEEEDDKDTFSESSGEDMCELTLGIPGRSSRPNRHHHHSEEASTGLSLKLKDGYELLKDDDIPSDGDDKSRGDDYDEEEDETRVSKSGENLWKFYPTGGPPGSCYSPPVWPLHEEYNALYFMRGNPYHICENDDTCSKKDDESFDDEEEEEEDETDLETSGTSYNPSRYHHRNGSRDGYELLKNDDTSSQDDDGSWPSQEWRRKHGMILRDVSYVSLVDDDDDGDDDEVSDKLQGFVDVKKEETANKTKVGEVDTLSPESDWVYVTRD